MARINLRRGTTTEWSDANPILAQGEPGLDTATRIMKIGDGVTAWANLGGFDSSGSSGSAPVTLNADSTAIIPVDNADSWIVGSDRMDQDTADTTKNFRAFFNKTKGAFRAGRVTGNQWDDTSVGTTSHAEGLDNRASGPSSHAEGLYCVASGEGSHAEGNSSQASGKDSHAEGSASKAAGTASHAEGYFTEVTWQGAGAHSEGYQTLASAEAAHAEGKSTTASGLHSHAEGQSTKASGYQSHAEGNWTEASGQYSRASGSGSVANRVAQSAHGSNSPWGFGRSQVSQLVLDNETANATPALLTSSTTKTASITSAAGPNVWTLLANRTHKFRVDVAARRADVAGEAAGWEFSGLIARDATGDPYFVGTVEGRAWGTVAAAAWDVTLSINVADPANPYLAITATGEAAKTIRWVASLDVVEVG